MNNRNSQFDVTNTVDVSNSQAVCNIVCDIFHGCYIKVDVSLLRRAFEDFDNLFEGHFDGYHGCDTFYHDKQHTLDMTLALARIIDGHERQNVSHCTLGSENAVIAIITALFHDSGYIREKSDIKHQNGAEYTRIHVSRSATFLRKYLNMIGQGHYAEIAANMVHYTGYEVMPENIKLPDAKYHLLGYMIGTADLIAQMADRCYLEKCRDRLYPEFVLGGLTQSQTSDGKIKILFKSAEDLLSQTPRFYQNEVQHRLDHLFKGVYKYAGIHFSGENFYLESVSQNVSYMKSLLKTGSIDQLRRLPPENTGTREYLELYKIKKN